MNNKKLKKFLRVFHGRSCDFISYIRFDINSLDNVMDVISKTTYETNFMNYKLWIDKRYTRKELDGLICIRSDNDGLMMIRRKCGEQYWNICWRNVAYDGYNPPSIPAIRALLTALEDNDIHVIFAKKQWEYINPIEESIAQKHIDRDLEENKSRWNQLYDNLTIIEAQRNELSWNMERNKKISDDKNLIYTFKEE